MATPLHVKAKGSWKTVDIPQDLLNNDDFSALVELQVLTDYDLVEGVEDEGYGHKKTKKAKKRKKQIDNDPEPEEDEVNISPSPAKKKKKKQVQNVSADTAPQPSEAVTNNDIVPSQKEGKKKQKNKKKDVLKQSLKNGNLVSGESVQNVTDDSPEEMQNVSPQSDAESKSKKKKKKRKKKGGSKENAPSSQNVESLESVHDVGDKGAVSDRKKKKKRKKKQNLNKNCPETEKATDIQAQVIDVKRFPLDMTAWGGLFVPDVLLKALEEQGFDKPSMIQKMVLPSAIRDRKDILGAAETGSGKTLAFGIPVLAKILTEIEIKMKQLEEQTEYEGGDGDEEEVESNDENDDEDDEEMEGVEEEEEEDEEEEAKSDDEDDDVDDDDDKEDEEEEEGENETENENSNVKKKQKSLFDHPLALILEPTRELAMQVKKHLTAVASHTDIKFAAIVGGMSIEKQRRILSKKPHVVIATPGRLWQLIEEGNEFLSQVSQVYCLVVDEADRMVEKGHFEELTKLMEILNKSDRRRKNRQTFVMSATLTMDVSMPKRLLNKAKKKVKHEDKLKTLTERICLGLKPKVVDLTPKDKVAQTLTELRVNCKADEKDMYLYYFLCEHPGRTLVFVNSKDCLRRLVSVFTLLQCQPLPLHADMHQKQRLKNLDKFTESAKGFLLASDVAARGLDIPKVDHVIHYQVPRTMENYIHRSGRTARASNLGLSVMFVSPEEARDYRKIIQGVRNGEELPLLPVEGDLIPAAKQRIQLAQTVDVKEHRVKKKKAQNNFFIRAAEEMDMIIDDRNLLEDLGDDDQQSTEKNQLRQLKNELSSLLRGPLAPLRMTKYPTKSGQLANKKVVNLFDTKS